jgi:two-component system LytT family response regulator
LKVLIVDDEPLARRGVRVRLEAIAGVEIAGECASGRDAVRAIERLRPDLVLLDVQMPGMGGFAVIDAIGVDAMPAVIFLTAHDEHALRAFDARATDYLLKPIDDERFVLAIARAKERLRPPRPLRTDARIVVRDRGRVVLIEASDIDWIASEGDYVRVHSGGRGFLHRETTAAMEARLDPAQFARIHRSTIVNVARIQELRPQGDREFLVVLKDGTRLKASRGYRDRLRQLVASGRQLVASPLGRG